MKPLFDGLYHLRGVVVVQLEYRVDISYQQQTEILARNGVLISVLKYIHDVALLLDESQHDILPRNLFEKPFVFQGEGLRTFF